jgi:hypothetical protein
MRATPATGTPRCSPALHAGGRIAVLLMSHDGREKRALTEICTKHPRLPSSRNCGDYEPRILLPLSRGNRRRAPLASRTSEFAVRPHRFNQRSGPFRRGTQQRLRQEDASFEISGFAADPSNEISFGASGLFRLDVSPLWPAKLMLSSPAIRASAWRTIPSAPLQKRRLSETGCAGRRYRISAHGAVREWRS